MERVARLLGARRLLPEVRLRLGVALLPGILLHLLVVLLRLLAALLRLGEALLLGDLLRPDLARRRVVLHLLVVLRAGALLEGTYYRAILILPTEVLHRPFQLAVLRL